ncbi:hypothetical protein EG329_002087 [Mollisiaceae sp. DMI_Dod_QoI]|nr:hypothetical protein EG329_002087 [Helotiales sp. DMI_Dod_QoI]
MKTILGLILIFLITIIQGQSALSTAQCRSSCSNASYITGLWRVEAATSNDTEYISATTSSATISEVLATFQLSAVTVSGNYILTMATPGCIRDNTCSNRGLVNVTGTMSSDDTFTAQLFQTNNFDKVDQVYFGYVNVSSFPTITMTPTAGQDLDTITIVAQSIHFGLVNATVASGSSSSSTGTSSSTSTSTGTPGSSTNIIHHSSLSTAARIGIGVAVPVAAIVVAALLGAYLVRKKRRERKMIEGLHDKPQLDAIEVPRQELETKANARELEVREIPGELVSPAEPAELVGDDR